mmetsp:Transcript_984/g.2044  ORF Transcript_984/g.2044 Transcript_984/m.2044 type:complete len:259 (-) Transcript_984:703-1479(-)
MPTVSQAKKNPSRIDQAWHNVGPNSRDASPSRMTEVYDPKTWSRIKVPVRATPSYGSFTASTRVPSRIEVDNHHDMTYQRQSWDQVGKQKPTRTCRARSNSPSPVVAKGIVPDGGSESTRSVRRFSIPDAPEPKPCRLARPVACEALRQANPAWVQGVQPAGMRTSYRRLSLDDGALQGSKKAGVGVGRNTQSSLNSSLDFTKEINEPPRRRLSRDGLHSNLYGPGIPTSEARSSSRGRGYFQPRDQQGLLMHYNSGR